MAITVERAEMLVNYLNMNEERAKMLLTISAEDACAKINDDGYDFAVEELIAFADALEKDSVVKQGELNEEDLHNISGGIRLTTAYMWGARIGYWLGKTIKEYCSW